MMGSYSGSSQRFPLDPAFFPQYPAFAQYASAQAFGVYEQYAAYYEAAVAKNGYSNVNLPKLNMYSDNRAINLQMAAQGHNQMPSMMPANVVHTAPANAENKSKSESEERKRKRELQKEKEKESRRKHERHKSNVVKEEKVLRDLVSKCVVRDLKRYLDEGQIKTKEDFKHLARKLTHLVMEKEQRHALAKAQKRGGNAAVPIYKFDEQKQEKIAEFVGSFFEKLSEPYQSHSAKLKPTS